MSNKNLDRPILIIKNYTRPSYITDQYREQGYKSLLLLSEKCIFENVPLVVVNMKSGTMKVVNMKFSLLKNTIIFFL